MTAQPRVVLDSNVLLASQRSPHPKSPGAEILLRCEAGETTLLYSADTLNEYTEKLLEHGIADHDIRRVIRLLGRHGELVRIEFYHFRHYPVDQDDVMFLLCAMNGSASHLVSYDGDLLDLRHFYLDELVICEPLEFLHFLRWLAEQRKHAGGGS